MSCYLMSFCYLLFMFILMRCNLNVWSCRVRSGGAALSPGSRARLLPRHIFRSGGAAAALHGLRGKRRNPSFFGNLFLRFFLEYDELCVDEDSWGKSLERCLSQGFLRHQLNNPCDDQFEALPMHLWAVDARTTKHVSWRRSMNIGWKSDEKCDEKCNENRVWSSEELAARGLRLPGSPREPLDALFSRGVSALRPPSEPRQAWKWSHLKATLD